MFTTFRGGQAGVWRITALSPVKGDALPPVTAISITSGAAIALPLLASQTSWRVGGGGGRLPRAAAAEKGENLEAGGGGRAAPAPRRALVPRPGTRPRWGPADRRR